MSLTNLLLTIFSEDLFSFVLVIDSAFSVIHMELFFDSHNCDFECSLNNCSTI